MSRTWSILIKIERKWKQSTTFIIFKVPISILMAVIGLTYGFQVANLMGVANNIAGSEAMVLVFTLNLFLEGFGAFLGAPITSK